MSATCARVTRSLPCGNPNVSRTDERPVQLIRTDGHVDNPEPFTDYSQSQILTLAKHMDTLYSIAEKKQLGLKKKQKKWRGSLPSI